MKHLFVPYELALLAKEKGFNEPCIAEYFHKELTFYTNEDDEYSGECVELTAYKNESLNHFDVKNTVSAPLYQQLVDWFREKHSLSVEVSEWSKNFSGKVKPIGKSLKFQSADKSYYEALESVLTEAFKLI